MVFIIIVHNSTSSHFPQKLTLFCFNFLYRTAIGTTTFSNYTGTTIHPSYSPLFCLFPLLGQSSLYINFSSCAKWPFFLFLFGEKCPKWLLKCISCKSIRVRSSSLFPNPLTRQSQAPLDTNTSLAYIYVHTSSLAFHHLDVISTSPTPPIRFLNISLRFPYTSASVPTFPLQFYLLFWDRF